MKNLILVLCCSALASLAVAAAEVSDFNQSALPRLTKIITASGGSPDRCQLTVYLHGHLLQNFSKDVMTDLDMINAGEKNPGGILVVPKLMSNCRTACNSARYYDSFSFENYLQKIVHHLQSRGLCAAGVEKIHLIGHSGAYYFFKYRIMDELIANDCRRPKTLLGKVENVVLIDALYYGAGNRTMKNAYTGFAATLRRCNTNLRFAHLTRKFEGHRPYINSCELDNCRFLREPSLDKPVQMIEADSSYNRAGGHWDVVKDTLPVWFRLFQALF